MKKITFLLTFFLFAWSMGEVVGQEATIADTVNTQPPVVSEVPEILWVVINGDSVGIPTKDGKVAAETLKEIINENKGNWPKTVYGWVALILGIIFSARGTVFLTSAKNIYAFLRTFLRKTLHIVAFIAGVSSAGVTFLVGQWQWDWQIFMTIWGITSFLGVYVYETWIKKPEEETVKA